MDSVKIEKNIPLPEGHPRGYHPRWPFRQMEVGDSLYVEGYDVAESAFRSAYKHGVRFGKKFKRRKEGDGLRIWRLK